MCESRHAIAAGSDRKTAGKQIAPFLLTLFLDTAPGARGIERY
jgi:hypothetical protein